MPKLPNYVNNMQDGNPNNDSDQNMEEFHLQAETERNVVVHKLSDVFTRIRVSKFASLEQIQDLDGIGTLETRPSCSIRQAPSLFRTLVEERMEE